MTNHTVSAAFVKQFEAQVHQEFQEQGQNLSGVVRSKTGVVGDAVSFPIYGKGAATGRGLSGSEVVTMGTQAHRAEAPLKNYIAAEYSDVFDEAALNFDDRTELAKVIAYAMRRTEDCLIVNAMAKACGVTISAGNEAVQSGTTPTVGKGSATKSAVVGSDTAALTVDVVRKAKRQLDENGVPNSERYFITSPAGIDAMLASEKVTSSDYANVKALVQGEMDTFMGFKFIMLADCTAGATATGLPFATSGTKRCSFAFHRAAIGYGNAIDKTTMADWVANHASYLVQSHLKAGAISLDFTGIVGVVHKEDAI